MAIKTENLALGALAVYLGWKLLFPKKKPIAGGGTRLRARLRSVSVMGADVTKHPLDLVHVVISFSLDAKDKAGGAISWPVMFFSQLRDANDNPLQTLCETIDCKRPYQMTTSANHVAAFDFTVPANAVDAAIYHVAVLMLAAPIKDDGTPENRSQDNISTASLVLAFANGDKTIKIARTTAVAGTIANVVVSQYTCMRMRR